MTNLTPTAALVAECQRQFGNCRDTAVSFIIWLRLLRWTRTALLVAPLVFGAIATWQIIDGSKIAAVCALLATVVPSVYRASKLDKAINDYETLAGEFTNLRDRFRQLAEISSQKPFPEFEAEAKPILERMEKARKRALAPPDWTFRAARKKVKAGHYTHDSDKGMG